MDLAVQSAALLTVRVDTLEVLHLRHKDEPFMGLSGDDLFDYIDALQKFRTRASSDNFVIYNCSNIDLCCRNFSFRYPYPYRLATKFVITFSPFLVVEI